MGQPVPMVAAARQVYNGRALRAGDEFDAASDSDADDLVAVNMARRRVVTKQEAAPAEQPQPQSDGNLTRGQYGRRDMQARRR